MFLRRMVSSQIARSSSNRPSRVIYPLIHLSSGEQFRRVISSFIVDNMTEQDSTTKLSGSPPGLRKVPPYWYPYTTMAKERWLGREILEIVSTEFRDRSMEYYVSCISQIQGCSLSNLSYLAICIGIWSDHHQWKGCKT